MRLIDAHDLWTEIMMLPHNGDMISSEEVEKAIVEAPTVDAVEVVRCKDCKMWRRSKRGNIGFVDSPIGYCPFMGVEQNHNNFCSHGIRRETNE